MKVRNNFKKPDKQAIVLLSGGLDSATALYIAKDRGFKCSCLIFDYGQRHRKEIDAAVKIAQSAQSPAQVLKINLGHQGSTLLDYQRELPRLRQRPVPEAIPSTYVPARNIIFLSFALSYAETIGAEAIFIGAHSQDYSGYPDCRASFFRAFNKVISCGTKAGVEKRGIKIETPLINKGKAEIIRLGKSLGVPFEETWSCYNGQESPCGECDSCYFRAKGFLEAGISDPVLLKKI